MGLQVALQAKAQMERELRERQGQEEAVVTAGVSASAGVWAMVSAAEGRGVLGMAHTLR